MAYTSAKYFFCRALLNGSGKTSTVILMGRSIDVDALMLTLDSLRSQFEGAARGAADDAMTERYGVSTPPQGERVAWRNSFLHGCQTGYENQLAIDWRKPEDREATTAIVLVTTKAINQFMRREYPHVHTIGMPSSRGAGYSSGYRRGRNASGRTALGSGG